MVLPPSSLARFSFGPLQRPSLASSGQGRVIKKRVAVLLAGVWQETKNDMGRQHRSAGGRRVSCRFQPAQPLPWTSPGLVSLSTPLLLSLALVIAQLPLYLALVAMERWRGRELAGGRVSSPAATYLRWLRIHWTRNSPHSRSIASRFPPASAIPYVPSRIVHTLPYIHIQTGPPLSPETRGALLLLLAPSAGLTCPSNHRNNFSRTARRKEHLYPSIPVSYLSVYSVLHTRSSRPDLGEPAGRITGCIVGLTILLPRPAAVAPSRTQLDRTRGEIEPEAASLLLVRCRPLRGGRPFPLSAARLIFVTAPPFAAHRTPHRGATLFPFQECSSSAQARVLARHIRRGSVEPSFDLISNFCGSIGAWQKGCSSVTSTSTRDAPQPTATAATRQGYHHESVEEVAVLSVPGCKSAARRRSSPSRPLPLYPSFSAHRPGDLQETRYDPLEVISCPLL